MKLKKIDRINRNEKLVMVHSNGTLYNFSRFKGLSNYVLDFYDGNILTKDAKKSNVNWRVK